MAIKKTTRQPAYKVSRAGELCCHAPIPTFSSYHHTVYGSSPLTHPHPHLSSLIPTCPLGPNQHIQSAGGSNVSERIPGPEALRALLTSPAPHQATGPHYPPADPGYSGSEKLGVPQAAAHRHDNSRNYQAGHAAQQQGQQGRELGQQSTFISRQLFEVGAGMGMVGWGPGAMQAARNAAGGQAAQGAGAGQAGAQHKVKEQLQGDRASQGKEQGEQEEESEEEEDSEEEDGEETEEDESIGGPHAWMWALIRKAFSMPLRTAGAKTGRCGLGSSRPGLGRCWCSRRRDAWTSISSLRALHSN